MTDDANWMFMEPPKVTQFLRLDVDWKILDNLQLRSSASFREATHLPILISENQNASLSSVQSEIVEPLFGQLRKLDALKINL